MAAVTQLIPSYLGGVSKQTDQKKLPGQVRECLNAYPDPTFGLRKRPGLKFIKTIHESSDVDSPDFADSKWFFIKRDDNEQYIGNIGKRIRIWNKEGTECTVHDDSYTLTYDPTDDTKNGGNNVISEHNIPVIYGSGSGGSGMTVNIVDSGYVYAATMISGGTGYTSGTDVATTGGTGTGYSVNITVAGGVVQSFTKHSYGEGYTVGDVVTVSGGDANCTLKITGMDGAGEVHVCNPGTGYAAGDYLRVSFNGHTGTGDIFFTLTAKPADHYLNTTRDNYDILTVQDNSVITNKTKVVAKQAAPVVTLGSKATVRLFQVKYSCLYKVQIKIGGTTYTAEYTTIEKEDTPPSGPNNELVNTAEKILSELKSDLDALAAHTPGDLTTTQLEATLELSFVTPTVTATPTGNGGGNGTNGTLTNLATTTGGSGTGLTVDVVIAGGVATNITVNTGGRNYAKDDVITISKSLIPGTGTGSKIDADVTTTIASIDAAKIDVTAIDNQGNATLRSFGQQVNVVSDLPTESTHDRIVKIVNSSEGSAEDTYWSKFVAEDEDKGAGYWAESLDPTVSPGLDSSTMPHQLRNTAANVFVFDNAAWVDRKVGDEITNSDPSFVGFKIQQAFFHNNRLGILSEDNVVLSKSGEFYDFYFTTALTQTSSDPIDINCSTIRPAVLHAIVPTAQGLVLFSKNQQFILFSDAEVLTPSSAVVRGISNYEIDSNIDPVDVGTHINFVSKTPSYSRVFGMMTRGAEESPIVDDTSRIVSEWIPDTVTNLLSSPQNFLIALYGTLDKHIYLHKTYSVGDKTVMQSWFRWGFPGNIQHISIDSDTMWTVIEYKGKYILTSASLTQTPEEKIIITSDGQQVNPHMDLYGSVSSMSYDSTNELTKCYLPSGMKDNANLTPVLVIAGNGTTNFAGVTESGFTITPDRPTGQDHTTSSPYFEVPKKDISGLTAADVIVGYKYNYDVELPKTYFKMNPEGTLKDYTASLTVARMKFALGLSSVCSFKVKSKGYRGDLWEGTVTDAKTGTSEKAYEVPFSLKEENGIKVTLNGVRQSSYEVVSTDTQSTVTFTTAPEGHTVKQLYGGTGYTAATGVATTSSGSGTGLTVNTTVSSGVITAVTINSQGTGYKPNEVITISGNGVSDKDATLLIDALPQAIAITTDTWYDTQPSSEAGQYLADDVPLAEENIFTVPIHQRSENFNMRVFSDSPFPVSLTSMMWEGQYSPRFYRRT